MVFLLAFFILAAGLFSQIRAEIGIKLHKSACFINVRLLFFFKLIKIDFLLKAEWSYDDGLRLLQFKRSGEVIALYVQDRKKDAKKDTLKKWIISKWSDWAVLHRLEITGRIGSDDDAYETVMYCGILKIVLDWAVVFYFPPKSDKNAIIHIEPEFRGTVFRLNLEGIINISPIQIIITAMKAVTQNERKYYYVTPNREHYENNYGAN
ncbi:MAG: hypothetical protein BWY11_00562 [Firmicutes bacterium ADurb.Bin182]|nr:MAG: hypothetical protein BWY11_00562 [Firmicutes bacterium ADurb.Bin182]